MNTKRHPDYINIKHKINSCVRLSTLESNAQVVKRFYEQNKGEDANDLMILFLQKRDELNPEYKWESGAVIENYRVMRGAKN